MSTHGKSKPIRYRINFDISNNVMVVWLDRPPRDAELGMTWSDDRQFVVGYYMRGNLPHVYVLYFYHANMFSIIQDWIEDGIEAALGGDFDDAHYKGSGLMWEDDEIWGDVDTADLFGSQPTSMGDGDTDEATDPLAEQVTAAASSHQPASS